MPLLALTLSLVVLSQSALMVRLADIPSASIGFWRMALVLPVVGVLLLVKRQGAYLRALTGSQLLRLLLAGFFLFAHFYTWFLSVQLTSVANAMILFCSNPLFTALMGWMLFSEPLGRRLLVSMGIAFIGVVLLVSGGIEGSSWKGDALGLLCGLLFSGYMLASKSLRQELPNLPFAFVTYGLCGAIFLLVVLYQQGPLWGFSATTWWSLAGLGFGSTLLGHSLLTFSLQHFPVGVISVATLSEPAIATMTGYWFLGESITKMGFVGMALVTFGVVNLFWPSLRGVWKGNLVT